MRKGTKKHTGELLARKLAVNPAVLGEQGVHRMTVRKAVCESSPKKLLK